MLNPLPSAHFNVCKGNVLKPEVLGKFDRLHIPLEMEQTNESDVSSMATLDNQIVRFWLHVTPPAVRVYSSFQG